MPPTYLIIDSNDHDYYDTDYVDYLLEIEYNSTPSTLIDIPVSEQQLGEIAFYDALGASVDDINSNIDPHVPIGKLVV